VFGRGELIQRYGLPKAGGHSVESAQHRPVTQENGGWSYGAMGEAGSMSSG
jgi:hypothetical protein